MNRRQPCCSRGRRKKETGGDISRYQNRYAFSGKIICGDCGGTFKRRKHYKPSGPYIAWTCSNHIDDKAMCGMKYIADESVKTAFVTMLRKLFLTKTEVLQPFVQVLNGGKDKDKLVKLKELEDQLEKNVEQKQVLTGLMSSGSLEPGVFNQQLKVLEEEGGRLLKQKDALSRRIGANMAGAEEAVKLLAFLSGGGPAESFDGDTFQGYTDQIVVISREEIEFRLKCGLRLRERLVD